MTRRDDKVTLRLLALAVASVCFVGCAHTSIDMNDMSDTRVQVARYGLSYEALRADCVHDPKALRGLFLCSQLVDAAGAETYAHDLESVLAQIGEERFIQVLESIYRDIRDDVLLKLAYVGGWDEEGSDCWINFQEKYPRLAMIVSNHMTPTE